MQLVEAYEVLGVGSSVSQEELTQAYVRQKANYESGMLRASNEAVKAKFQKQLEELEYARQLLLPNYVPTPMPGQTPPDAAILGSMPQMPNQTPPGLFETPLTATQFADLPTPSPQLSAGGFGTGIGGMQQQDTPISSPHWDHSGTPSPGGAPVPGISIAPNQVLLNRYEVKRVVGVGGMGAVYAAYDRVLGMDVALKVLLPQLAQIPVARERFLHEAKISISLTHPNIANVKEVQQQGDLCFLTMELLQGRTLRQEMEMKASVKMPFSPKEVIALCKPLCDALGYAHQFTVHRDISPENIWLCKDGTVKVMDFGIALLITPTRATKTLSAMGKPLYMAPEQMENAKDADRRADQYSLAVVIYELLAGKLPTGRAKSLAELRPDVPAALSAAVDKALATNPEDRFADMEHFYKAISKKSRTAVGTKKLMIGALAVALLAAGVFGANNTSVRNWFREQFSAPSAPFVEQPTLEGKNIRLKWKDTSEGLASEFTVFRQQAGSNKADELQSSSKQTFLDEAKLQPATKYTYTVVAKTGKKFSPPSSEVSIETLPGPPPPVTITKPTAVATDPEHSVQLSMTTGANGSDVVKSLQRSTDGISWETLPAVGADFEAGKFVDHGLQPDTQYQYRVNIANKGGETTGTPVTHYTLPVAPEGLEAKATGDKVVVTWKSDLKEGRDLVLMKDKQPVALSDEEKQAKTWTFNDAELGHSYSFALAIKNPEGVIGKAAPATVTLPTAAPRNLKIAKSGPDSILLQWEKDKDIRSYQILRKEDDKPFEKLSEVSGAEKEYLDKGISRGKNYAYKLVSVNPGGPSEPSDPTDVVMARLPPPELPQLTVKPKDNKKEVLVNWKFSKADAVNGIKQLVIERSPSADGQYTAIQSFNPPFGVGGVYTDNQGLDDGHEYFYQMRVMAQDYADPFFVPFPSPIIPKLQAVVIPGTGNAAAAGNGAAAKPAPAAITPVFGLVAIPSPPSFRQDQQLDAILKGLSTPTPTPASKGGGGGGGGASSSGAGASGGGGGAKKGHGLAPAPGPAPSFGGSH